MNSRLPSSPGVMAPWKKMERTASSVARALRLISSSLPLMELAIWALSCPATSVTFFRAVRLQEICISSAVPRTLRRMNSVSAVRNARRRRGEEVAGAPGAASLSPVSGRGTGDEAGAALEADIGPEPFREDEDPVAVADQEKHVDHAPEQPGKKAAHPDPAEIRHGRGPADGGERAVVAVAEVCFLHLALEPLAQQPGHEGTLLLGGGGEARYGPAVPSDDKRRIADDEDLRMARQAEIGIDLDPAGAIFLCVQPLGGWRGRHAGGPDHAFGFDPLAPVDGHTHGPDIGHHGAEPHLDAELLQIPLGIGRERRREGRQDPLPGLDQQDAGLARVDV